MTRKFAVNWRVKSASQDPVVSFPTEQRNLYRVVLRPGRYTLHIDYPLSRHYVGVVDGRKMKNLKDLLLEISKRYHKIYESPRWWGIWGHCIGDLVIEAVEITQLDGQPLNGMQGYIQLSVGS